jgi:hypothetical protein
LHLGSGVGSTGNDYSSAPSSAPDGGESGSNGVTERGVDVGEDEGNEEISAITFKGTVMFNCNCDLYYKFSCFFQRNKYCNSKTTKLVLRHFLCQLITLCSYITRMFDHCI